jgi:hypothetical protein
VCLIGLTLLWPLRAPIDAQSKQQPTVQIPNPGVPQIMTMEAKFVRAAYNNEAYVILGYQVNNRSVGEEWMLLEVGMTVLERRQTPSSRATSCRSTSPAVRRCRCHSRRASLANTSAIQARTRVQRDSINYFPPMARWACPRLFSDLDQRVMPWDEVELSNTRACLGRLYFHIPGGIAYGQYWLNVKFEKSVIRVPFRIFTEEEEKVLSKNYSSIEKQVKEAFKPKKK